jgi:GTPase involved in cell partitioning and DNA repair
MKYLFITLLCALVFFGAYQFTTLEPNLGALYNYVLADIPGLIEGASEGKGLGHKFLRHIKRTKMLFHCISLENESVDDIRNVYKTIRKELEDYHPDMVEKKEVILLTKSDVYTPALLAKKVADIKANIKEWKQKDVLVVSVYDIDSLKKLSDFLTKEFAENNKRELEEKSIEEKEMEIGNFDKNNFKGANSGAKSARKTDKKVVKKVRVTKSRNGSRDAKLEKNTKTAKSRTNKK